MTDNKQELTLEAKLENSIFWINWLRDEIYSYKKELFDSVLEIESDRKKGMTDKEVIEKLIDKIGHTSRPYFIPTEEKQKLFKENSKLGLI